MYRFLYWLVLQRLPAEGTHRVSFALLRVLVAIPGLGALFKSKRNSEIKTELVILLRPIVIDDSNAATLAAEAEKRVEDMAISGGRSR